MLHSQDHFDLCLICFDRIVLNIFPLNLFFFIVFNIFHATFSFIFSALSSTLFIHVSFSFVFSTISFIFPSFVYLFVFSFHIFGSYLFHFSSPSRLHHIFFYEQKIKCAGKCFVLPLWVKGSCLQCEYSKKQREKILWVCKLQIEMKTEGCDFFWWVKGNNDGTYSTAEEQ
ncbi:hypothetical protein CXB51_027952 [Gossypium anomalum]|uniref:Uncharacterized protein n=1 Tax=Gossypium anomalum TaxID=47600 RepID=A0A8J5YHY3_9ROSI|nr:hypothetical protein CXB51_027952 [Gossypium anomalum]